MLRTQYPFINSNGEENSSLIKHYSDENKYILQVETGKKYSEAVDVYPCRYTYIETSEVIEQPKLAE